MRGRKRKGPLFHDSMRGIMTWNGVGRGLCLYFHRGDGGNKYSLLWSWKTERGQHGHWDRHGANTWKPYPSNESFVDYNNPESGYNMLLTSYHHMGSQSSSMGIKWMIVDRNQPPLVKVHCTKHQMARVNRQLSLSLMEQAKKTMPIDWKRLWTVTIAPLLSKYIALTIKWKYEQTVGSVFFSPFTN